MKFKVTEFIKDYVKINDEGEYDWIEVKKKYSANAWDDLTNLIMSMIDFTDGPIKFEVRKEEGDEQ
jgi:hypothetical protein